MTTIALIGYACGCGGFLLGWLAGAIMARRVR